MRTLVGTNEGAKPPRCPKSDESDLVSIPVKGSQVAGLVAGWLAVAMSMAAIGSASVARVGLGASEPQTQITVASSIGTGESQPVGSVVGALSLAGPALPQTPLATVSKAQSVAVASAVRKAATPVAAGTPSVTPQPPVVSSTPVLPPATIAPTDASAKPAKDPTGRPHKSPWTKPTKETTGSGTKAITSESLVVTAASLTSIWRTAESTVTAQCTGRSLEALRSTLSSGHTAGMQQVRARTATLSGPTRVSVQAAQSAGTPSPTVAH